MLNQPETSLSSSIAVSMDNYGVVTLTDKHPLDDKASTFTLDAGSAFNLLQWLHEQQNTLWQITQQKAGGSHGRA